MPHYAKSQAATLYDEEDGKHQEITLRSDASEINEQLEAKLNERMAIAGIEVVEARLNYLHTLRRLPL